MDKKNKILAIISISFLTLLIIGVCWMFVSGHLQYSKSGLQPKSVCGASIVDKYNEAMYYKIRQGSSEPSMDKQGVKDLATQIKQMTNYKNDPTCQTIIFWTAVMSDDYKTAKAAYDELDSLHEKRAFPDSNLRDDQPLFMYEEVLKGLTGSGFSEASPVGP